MELTKAEDPWFAGVVTTPFVNALVASLASLVPSTVLINVTFAPVTKPVPVTVTSVTGGVVESTAPLGLSDVAAGAAFTVKAPVCVEAPFASVTVRLYVPGTVAEVDAKLAVAVVEALSAPPLKVNPGAVLVNVTVPPLAANVPEGAVTVTVPLAPWPK